MGSPADVCLLRAQEDDLEVWSYRIGRSIPKLRFACAFDKCRHGEECFVKSKRRDVGVRVFGADYLLIAQYSYLGGGVLYILCSYVVIY